MRIGDLIPGDVFYIVDNPSLGPLLRKDATSGVAIDSFVEAEYLNTEFGTVRFLYHDLNVIKVGRIEHDYT